MKSPVKVGQGLAEQLLRPSQGFRRYPTETVRRIRFVPRAKEMAEAKIGYVERRIADLEKIREVLGNLVAACKGQGAVSECPILDALDEENRN